MGTSDSLGFGTKIGSTPSDPSGVGFHMKNPDREAIIWAIEAAKLAMLDGDTKSAQTFLELALGDLKDSAIDLDT